MRDYKVNNEVIKLVDVIERNYKVVDKVFRLGRVGLIVIKESGEQLIKQVEEFKGLIDKGWRILDLGGSYLIESPALEMKEREVAEHYEINDIGWGG